MGNGGGVMRLLATENYHTSQPDNNRWGALRTAGTYGVSRAVRVRGWGLRAKGLLGVK